MRRIVAVLIAIVAALGLGTTSAQAVTGNFVADYEHEYVGLIVFYDGDGGYSHRCSGSLLTETVFLTAGHCVTLDDAGTLAPAARVYFEQDVNDPATGAPFAGGVEAHTLHSYGFEGLGNLPQSRDVGLVILDQPVTEVYPEIDTYASLGAAGTLDSYGTGIDAKVDLSGYGVQNANKNHPVESLERLTAATFIIGGRNPRNNGGYNVQIASNLGGGRGGACFGDSGGPILLAGTDVVVAVNSFVLNRNCAGQAYAYRTDLQAVISWILEHAGAESGEIEIVTV
ncbi:MAG TPA: trypsin-like serine protease [Nocardioidaceae bacterium]|nr:trypsin-like serine protease [Nocardioidaceae bacterium]